DVVAENEALDAAGQRVRVDELAHDGGVGEILLEGRLLRDEPRHVLVETRGGSRMFVALSKRRQDLRQEARIRIDDLLVQADRVRAAALGPRELRANQRAPQRTRLAVRALLEVILGTRDIPGDAGLLGQ